VNVKGGGALQVSELGYRSAKGVKLEGMGVTPDIAVSLTLADLRSRRDAWLEAAEKFLKSPGKK
jgi:C-terminal processing protease CtpA/Prc